MKATTTHFPVDNGDMMLMVTESGRRILVDCNIRQSADDPGTEHSDVAAQLRERLIRDLQGRLYVDAFLLTHPDQDHCRGLKRHFHLGKVEDWSKTADKIVIKEMWSSPVVFRRASKDHTLCDDALAWGTEARRRVAEFRKSGWLGDGDRILIMGEDDNGKTDDLGPILIRVDQEFWTIAGTSEILSFTARLLAPLPADDEDEEAILSKNDSSVVLSVAFQSSAQEAARYLIGGDAEVAVWERLWRRNKDRASRLEYDVLIAPHHCSWHSLSYYSWSLFKQEAKVSAEARNALGQARQGAMVLASSKPIVHDDNDPPCIRAKREYESILSCKKGVFRCISDGTNDNPYELEVSTGGVTPKPKKVPATVASPYITGIGSQPFSHG